MKPDAAFWRDLACRFRRVPEDVNDPLRASWSAGGFGGSHGDWYLAGKGESERDVFDTLAAIGAIALGLPDRKATPVHWLETLRRESADFVDGGPLTSLRKDKYLVFQTGDVERLLEASARYCEKMEARALAFEMESPVETVDRRSRLAQNLDRLRKECGWSYKTLADKVGIAKSTVISHIRHQKPALPDTLRKYSEAFTIILGRPVPVAELEQ